MKLRPFVVFVGLSLMMTACSEDKSEKSGSESTQDEVVTESSEGTSGEEVEQIAEDPHSFSNPSEVGTKHIHLDMDVDFEAKSIKAIAHLELVHRNTQGKFIFDKKGLTIDKITLDGQTEVPFKVMGQDELLGEGIEIAVESTTKTVDIHYHTTEHSEALQWLKPDQTAGKEHPFLFTQGQAVLTRTWIPCQDSPSQRITYSASVTCPPHLMAVMSASNPVERNDEGVYEFEMHQTIPSYLIALAVGDLDFASIGARTGVYTEPSMIEASAQEFEDMETMLEVAEDLYGPYKWDRYDVIVLPPSFPYGGMENPRLTFATPTILAGDKSLVALIAHEMAHSWSGNLVTNATWDDFWLNEGFTVYFENRIMEAVYGKEYSDMLLMLSEQDLKGEIQSMFDEGKREDTFLKLRTAGRDPEVGLTAIAYDKGAFFLKMLETNVGRETFDAFLRQYFEEHQFQTMTTEKFMTYLNDNLLSQGDYDVNVDEWVYGQGLPASHVKVMSDKFAEVDEALAQFYAEGGEKEIAERAKDWTYQQTLHFIRQLDTTTTTEQMARLDEAFGFTNSGNSELLAEWFVKSIRYNYAGSQEKMKTFLMTVGRRKFLAPIYSALSDTPEGLEMAKEIYKDARKNYHSVSTGTIDEMLGWSA